MGIQIRIVNYLCTCYIPYFSHYTKVALSIIALHFTLFYVKQISQILCLQCSSIPNRYVYLIVYINIICHLTNHRDKPILVRAKVFSEQTSFVYQSVILIIAPYFCSKISSQDFLMSCFRISTYSN